jgi:hypothetical protein
MGIQLDWEIESERANVHQAPEDPNQRRKRRQKHQRRILILLCVLAVVGGVVGAILWRLDRVDQAIENALISTAEAEVAALRIANQSAFMDLQRSASDDWLNTQQNTFSSYQDQKLTQRLDLTGRVVDLDIDGQRGRVKIEEIIDDVPYVRTWFYWQYEDGWRHVPPDYTFWGRDAQLNTEGVTVNYQSVDEDFALSLSEQVTAWRAFSCELLGCENFPPITLDILPDEALQTTWAEGDPWRMRIPSPYTGLARQDLPFDPNQRLQVGNLIAERFIQQHTAGTQPIYPYDAYYLQPSLASWLVSRYTQINTNTFLLTSIANNYGEQAIQQLVHHLQPDSDISLLLTVTNSTSLPEMNVDWRDYLTWRLQLENELIARQEDTHFLNLYASNDNARDTAYARFLAGPSSEIRIVTNAHLEADLNGHPQLLAIAEVNDGQTVRQEALVFRLDGNTWKRAN